MMLVGNSYSMHNNMRKVSHISHSLKKTSFYININNHKEIMETYKSDMPSNTKNNLGGTQYLKI